MDFLFVYTYIFTYVHLLSYVYINISFCFFSHDIIVDRPSHFQYILNRLPHAAHTTSTWITFCNVWYAL